jgi:hypothetical protein
MADTAQNPPTASVWEQIGKAALAALAPVVIRALVDAFRALESKITPWDGQTERRAPRSPQASETP